MLDVDQFREWCIFFLVPNRRTYACNDLCALDFSKAFVTFVAKHVKVSICLRKESGARVLTYRSRI